MWLIAAAASEPEVNEPGSSLISRRLHYTVGACNHLFLLNARNCGYARMEDLEWTVVCCKELWLCVNGKIKDAQCYGTRNCNCPFGGENPI